MKQIKILMLHLGYGGVEKQTITMANGLADYYNIEIISFYKLMTEPAYKIDKRIKIKYLYEGGPNKEEFKNAVKAKNIFTIFKEGIKALKILYLKKYLIKKEILKNDADIYFSSRTSYGHLLNKYGSKEKLKITQEHNYIETLKYQKYITKHYRHLDYVIVLTKYQENMYQKWFKNTRVKIKRIENILEYNSEEVSKLNNNAIIAVGRLDPIKDFTSLLNVVKKAIPDNPKLKLYLLGDGEEKEKLTAKIKELKIEKNVVMPGFVSAKEVKDYMLKSDLFIMTSKKDCFPMVILEAFNCGLPVISFDILTGPREMIRENHNGYLISNRDYDLMAEKINRTLSNPDKLRDLGKNAKKDSKNYLTENIIQKWLTLLK